jgi:pantoate--beta-alanine ligase
MHLFTDIETLRSHLKLLKAANKKIGLVPTMGALHTGHLSLISRAQQDCDVVVSSIYVNPTQFTNPEDLIHYPRTLAADRRLLESANCDILFLPNDQVIYPQQSHLKFNFGFLETVMEGKYRPGHFNGVAIVVSKLFHIVDPDVAYFGQKDLQQFAIIRQLVNDLSFSVQLIACPIIREKDGLAMSSRNVRLSSENRAIAPVLYQTLQTARNLLSHMPVNEVKKEILGHLANFTQIQPEYFEIVDSTTLESVQDARLHKQVSLCIAAYIGEVRLIDNIYVNTTEV